MIYRIIELGLTLEIDDDLLYSLVDIGTKHFPNEFGGFLVGYYSDNSILLTVTDIILPNKYKSTPYLFERNTAGVDQKLRDFYSQSPQKYYVGEWHTHPDNLPTPSGTDLNAMRQIAAYEDVSIKNPVLLIIGYRMKKPEIKFYVFLNNQLYSYEQYN